MNELFQVGDEGSRAAVVQALTDLQNRGSEVLAAINDAQRNILLAIERRLAALNARRQGSNRVLTSRTPVKFVMSDVLDVDQARSSATLRPDAQAGTLRERNYPPDAIVRSTRFSSDSGTIETMDAQQTLFRVHADNNQAPTGRFDLELVIPLQLNLLVFDLAAMPSQPEITVSTSSNGLNFTDAQSVSLNGYRLNAWIAPAEVRFIRLVIVPSHADDINGSNYTFGITSFSADSIEFHLLSEIITKPITFVPQSQSVRVVADGEPKLTYFLALGDEPFMEVVPGIPIPIPGSDVVSTADVPMNATGLLAHSWPVNAYLSTLRVTREGDNTVIPLAPGLSPADPSVSALVHEYVGIDGVSLNFISSNISASVGKTFSLAYVTGPDVLTAQLKVQLSTSDRAVTPVFRGASLEEV